MALTPEQQTQLLAILDRDNRRKGAKADLAIAQANQAEIETRFWQAREQAEADFNAAIEQVNRDFAIERGNAAAAVNVAQGILDEIEAE